MADAARSEENEMKLQHKRARTTKINKKDKRSECAEAGSAGQNASAPSKKSCEGSNTSNRSDPERQITIYAGSPQQPYSTRHMLRNS